MSTYNLSMRGYLALIMLSVVAPVAIFAGILFSSYYTSELHRVDEELLGDARQLALTVDRELSGLQSVVQTLTSSNPLIAGDYERFYLQASRVRDITGLNVLLRDINGQQIMNTRVPWGTALPLEPLEDDQRAKETRQPIISNLIIGAVAQHSVVTITVPIVRGGAVTHFLNLSIEAERFSEIAARSLGAERSGGVVDGKGMILARSSRSAEFVGTPAAADFIRRMNADDGVVVGASNRAGERVRAAYARSKISSWKVWVSYPAKAALAPLMNTLWTLAALGLALAAAAFLIAYAFGGRLANSIQALSDRAAALGRGETLVTQQLPVREFNEVGREIVAASIRIREREHERDEAEQNLRRLSETLESNVLERTRNLVEEVQRRIEAEDVARQAQKMEAVGQLTGGVAHDFNNMLAIILGSLDLALRQLTRGDTQIEKFLVNAQEGGRRAAALTKRLLAFARQQPLEPESVEPNKLVSGMSELLRRSLGEMIRFETVLGAGLWRLYADANQLENAILNLAVNARDAMPEGGKLTIETANAYLDDKYTAKLADVSAGQYVQIAISDTGVGMNADVVEKAFEPFFTTKKSGSGTGLGLSQVYGFVKQSGGYLKIYSEPGHGTTVKIYLPRYFGKTAAVEETEEAKPLPMSDGNSTVLLAEDEESVRIYATSALQELGYKVVAAANGTAALELLEAHPEVSLLFTDVVMPDMNGRKLSEEALQRKPSLKVLFTTGYTRNAIVHNGVLDPDTHLLGKPFTVEQLAHKIAEVMKT